MRTEMGQRVRGQLGWAQHVLVPDHPTAATTLTSWFLHLPSQAPYEAWDTFLLSVVTLADVDGFPRPYRRYPQAEYELMVVSLDPENRPQVAYASTWTKMLPPSYTRQFDGVTRDQAIDMGRALALGCVHGQVAAETRVYVETPGGGAGRMMHVQILLQVWDQAVDKILEPHRTGGLHHRIN